MNLAIEPFHRGCGDEWSFINDLKSTVEIIELIGCPTLGMVLDTYHLGFDRNVQQWLPDIIPHLHLVQLGDALPPMGEMNRCLLGKGVVPIQQILRQLMEYNYEGPLEVELIGEDVEHIPYEKLLEHTLAIWNRVLDRSDHANTLAERQRSLGWTQVILKVKPASKAKLNMGQPLQLLTIAAAISSFLYRPFLPSERADLSSADRLPVSAELSALITQGHVEFVQGTSLFSTGQRSSELTNLPKNYDPL